MALAMKYAFQLRLHDRCNGDGCGSTAMDAVSQYIEGRSLPTVITDEYFYHKYLILLNYISLQRKLNMTRMRGHLCDIKFLGLEMRKECILYVTTVNKLMILSCNKNTVSP